MPQSGFAVGAVIRLDVIVKNSMTEDLLVWKVSPDADGLAEAYIGVVVRDADGKSLPRKDRHTVVHDGETYTFPKSWFTRKGAFIKPNHELHDFLLLSRLFDLNKPGTYSVSAVLETPVPNTGPNPELIKAESNKLTFNVYQNQSQ